MRTHLLALFLTFACSHKIEGPTPSVSGARNEHDQSTGPAYLCNAQGDPADGWLIDALGDKFAPLPTGALVGTAGVRMPDVALSGPQAYTVPSARVRFADKTRMPLAMPTKDSTADAHELPPGDYALTVTNVNGKSGSAAAAIRVVPPPKITAVSLAPTAGGPASTSLCADQAMTLTVTGSSFRTDVAPAVAIGLHVFSGTSIASVTATVITVAIPAGTFSAAETSGNGAPFTVEVRNSEGCKAPFGTDPIGPATVTAFPT